MSKQDFAVLSLTEPGIKTLPVEEVMSRYKESGTFGLLEPRMAAMLAAVAGRLDVVRHCVETRGVSVNTITAEEKVLIDNTWSDGESESKALLRSTPLLAALSQPLENIDVYLLSMLKK